MKILAYPYDWNPYQELLYERLRKDHNTVVRYGKFYPYVGAAIFWLQTLLGKFQGFDIVHVHWQAFYINVNIPYAKQLSYWSARLWLWWLKALRYKVVWTVHNVTPHQAQTANDIDVSRRLSRLANRVIAHSRFSVQQMEERGLDVSRVTVIPHGNYIGVYPDNISSQEARRALGIQDDETVVLFFGNIQAYKGVDDLVDAFVLLKPTKTTLLIAGSCSNENLREKIANEQKQANIVFHEGRVPDDQIAKYFKACDVVCLPFKAITSSGSALLALSFGKPLIAPKQGAITDMPDSVGFLYDEKQGLSQAMQTALVDNQVLKRKGQSALAYAQTLDWGTIADKMYEAYQGVLEQRS